MDYSNPWFYEGDIFDPEENFIEPYAGFVYLIINKIDDRMYIGKKFLWATKPKIIKGKRKKVKCQSDWKKYWGSSNKLKEDIDNLGHENFERHILYFCKTKTECAYKELKEQMDRDVLLNDSYYNEFIGGKINGKNLIHLERKNEGI